MNDVIRTSNERLSQIREHDFPILLEFHSKHALGPLTRPSCLVCGRVPEQWPPAIQHAELPGIVVCHPCRDRATHETGEYCDRRRHNFVKLPGGTIATCTYCNRPEPPTQKASEHLYVPVSSGNDRCSVCGQPKGQCSALSEGASGE